ncbi:MAG: ATP phosphoribosyltransferase [Candidatus Handelsmanbacteria bacterium RIFCSPLOWO2_12_FULL_64_10]|uniref:ATP phosphoribosyltransferase n=1 Tax=Handelsmanbacteria sp. (strain RIFCSPLOWO2_12_FULL_64_10) TaxID=1817868 RepID=A0A1F6C3N8_HANXR|nr:MAG: ATP phosphoribosyltransferase [Candidatus Handelsmanbacteria bacterium RIFCSPLOWO2_12_FULL_64_10]
MKRLKIGLPSGSLQEATLKLFAKAGYRITVSPRSYIPDIDDPELEGVLIRPQEIPRYVEREVLDVGLAGKDLILESGADVVEVAEMTYSKTVSRPYVWVIAVPEESPIRTLKDLRGKRIATELVNATKQFLASKGIEAEVEYSWGSTEVKVRIPGLVDAIVDGTETGSSLRANRLRVVETMFESTPRLIANHQAWKDPWKREKAENIVMLLRAALEAEPKVGLKMNVSRKNLSVVLASLPALNTPTVSNLTDPDWVALEIITDEQVVRDLIPKLKRAGAEGIIEYPLNKVVY